MHVGVEAEALREALAVTGKIATKSMLPVLEHVLVKTNRAGLEVAATNLDLWVQCHVPGRIEREGGLTLPARRLAEFVAALGKTPLVITADEKKATLVAGQGKSTISGITAEEFPPLPSSDGPTLQLVGRELHAALGRVLDAAAPDDSRPVLAGCLVRTRGDRLELVTADGFRLARTELAIAAGAGADISVIVPARSLVQARGLLPTKGDEQVTVRVGLQGDGQLPATFELETDRTTLVSKLIEGEYPDFARIVPRELKVRATVASDDLDRAQKSVKAVLASKAPIVRLAFRPGDDGGLGELVVSGQDAELGDAEFTLPAEVQLTGPDQQAEQVAFNGRYLGDALKALGGDQVTIGVNGPDKPGLFTAPGRPETYVVIMSMRVAR